MTKETDESLLIVGFNGQEDRLFKLLSQGLIVKEIDRVDEGWRVSYCPKQMGRKGVSFTEDEISEMRTMYDSGIAINDICSRFNIARNTLYKVLNQAQPHPSRTTSSAELHAQFTHDVMDLGMSIKDACIKYNISKSTAYSITANERRLRNGCDNLPSEVVKDVEKLIAEPDFAPDFAVKYDANAQNRRRLIAYVTLLKKTPTTK